jgi:hypothetical protein
MVWRGHAIGVDSGSVGFFGGSMLQFIKKYAIIFYVVHAAVAFVFGAYFGIQGVLGV